MNVLLSSRGTRGDVQPLLALALELKRLRQDATLCVAPNFRSWVESFGIPFIPMGEDKRNAPKFVAAQSNPPRTKLRAVAARFARDHFEVLRAAARGHDLLLSTGVLPLARSVAEERDIPYVYAGYCASVLPCTEHPPPMVRRQSLPRFANRLLWSGYEIGWNKLFRDLVNEQRAALGLEPVASLLRHVCTERPWLAADAVLSPAAPAKGFSIAQTGAWRLRDSPALPEPLERFLMVGDPPVYFGFGSALTPLASQTLIAAARAIGRRAIVSKGWSEMDVADIGTDCIAVGDVSHDRLFPRVAAIVHHGGAGTTTSAALAGMPQVVIPHFNDQHYFAERVRRLGIGVRGPSLRRLAPASLGRVLLACTAPERAERAREFAGLMEPHGACIAAKQLVREYGGGAAVESRSRPPVRSISVRAA